jgi:hypothetical protein
MKKELTNSQLSKLQNLKTVIFSTLNNIANGNDTDAKIGLAQAMADHSEQEFFTLYVKPQVHRLAVQTKLATGDSELDQIIINLA